MADGPQVFLSYAMDDSGLAHELADTLTRDGIRVWIDSQLRPGERWVKAIDRAVRDSQAFVVVLSPHLETSHNGMAELGFVLSEQRDSGKPLVLVRTGDARPFFSIERFEMVDGSGLPPREIAERVRHAAMRTIGTGSAAPG